MPNQNRRPESQAILILTQALRAGEISQEFYADQVRMLSQLALEPGVPVMQHQQTPNPQIRH